MTVLTIENNMGPRWHDWIIALAIALLAAAGVAALWGEEIRSLVDPGVQPARSDSPGAME